MSDELRLSSEARAHRDWLGPLLQAIATVIVLAVAMLAWGERLEGQVSAQAAGVAAVEARVTVIEQDRASNTEGRRAANAALDAKLDAMSTQLARITAQLQDLRDALKR
ncbi:MAG: hypothetical protein ACREFK_01555 [Stellaceae bacterium]